MTIDDDASSGSWIARPVPELNGFTAEWTDTEEIILSRRNRLYTKSAIDGQLTFLATVPTPFWKSLAARFRLIQRLLRYQFYNVVKLSDGSLFVTFDRSVGVIRDGEYRPVTGQSRPFRVLRSACALDADDSVYFGEYFVNHNRNAVRVYRYKPGRTDLETVHEFQAGEVRHVHGIYRDPFEKKLWCLTGDRGNECRFITTSDGFKTTEIFGSGDESWRSVSVQFGREHLFYGTDAEFEPNHLYRVRRTDGVREQLCELDGPVYYSFAIEQHFFFAVTAELCPSQQGRMASLWHVSDNSTPKIIVSFEKDRWPVRYLQYGILNLCRGPGDGEGFYLQAQGLKAVDNKVFRIQSG